MFTPLRAYIEKFIPLGHKDWDLLLPYLKERSIKKNDYFSREGKPCKEIGFILEGCMRHFYTKEGEEKTTYFYFENNLVTDYISCLTGKPGLISIQALSDAKLIVFPYALLPQLYSENKVWERFGRLIAEYIAMGLEERMTGLLMLSAEERYHQLLDSNKQKILERIPQHYIANYLGITPVSLSRIRNRVVKK